MTSISANNFTTVNTTCLKVTIEKWHIVLFIADTENHRQNKSGPLFINEITGGERTAITDQSSLIWLRAQSPINRGIGAAVVAASPLDMVMKDHTVHTWVVEA